MSQVQGQVLRSLQTKVFTFKKSRVENMTVHNLMGQGLPDKITSDSVCENATDFKKRSTCPGISSKPHDLQQGSKTSIETKFKKMNLSEVVTQKVQAPGSVENSGLVEVGLVCLVGLAFTLSSRPRLSLVLGFIPKEIHFFFLKFVSIEVFDPYYTIENEPYVIFCRSLINDTLIKNCFFPISSYSHAYCQLSYVILCVILSYPLSNPVSSYIRFQPFKDASFFFILCHPMLSFTQKKWLYHNAYN